MTAHWADVIPLRRSGGGGRISRVAQVTELPFDASMLNTSYRRRAVGSLSSSVAAGRGTAGPNSASNELAWMRRGRQQWEVDVEADLQSLGDGRKLADCGVAAAGLKRRYDRLGDLHALGQRQLCQPHGFASGADALTDDLGVDG